MKILHRSLPWDTLSGHRQRFRSVYSMLGELYEKLNTFQYLRGIVQIPRLSGDISKFISSLHRIEEHPTTREEYVEEVDTAGSEVNDLISVDDSLHTSMAYIQQEYSDLSSKYDNLSIISSLLSTINPYIHPSQMHLILTYFSSHFLVHV